MDNQHPDNLQPSSLPSEGLESDITHRKRLETYRENVKKFIGTDVHRLFVSGTQRQLDGVTTRIVEDEITDVKDLFELLDFRGQRRVLMGSLTLFEDTVVNLDARIKEMLERENETQHKDDK